MFFLGSDPVVCTVYEDVQDWAEGLIGEICQKACDSLINTLNTKPTHFVKVGDNQRSAPG